MLVASVDDQRVEEVEELKSSIRSIARKLTPTSEPRASIESAKHAMQYVAHCSNSRREDTLLQAC